MDTLLRRALPVPGGHVERLAVWSSGRAKLGATALTLAAMLSDRPFAEVRRPTARALGNFILSQQETNGRFRSILTMGNSNETFQSLYYPGEAILALSKAAIVLQESKYADAAFRGASYLAQNYLNADRSELPHDHWFMLAVAALNEIERVHLINDAVVKLGEAILHAAVPDEQLRVIYWDDGRVCPAATRAEGLTAAVEICLLSGQMEKAMRFLACLERAVAFCLAHQVDHAVLERMPGGLPLLGGFVQASNKPVVRIDYVQHAAGAISGLLRIRKLMGHVDASDL